jgi:pimeloyl-ACP methyl ester carboxylesterase
MLQTLVVICLTLASNVTATPTFGLLPGTIFDKFPGFEDAIILTSQGGHAKCVRGNLNIQASSSNVKLNYNGPSSQLALTELVLEYLQASSPLSASVVGAKTQVSGSYKINSQICWPSSGSLNASAIQFLTHGVGFDKSYWDFYSSDYSYIDFMAQEGYTTFSYDRLGVGASSHPDPIQVVQAQMEVEVAHTLIQGLRSGAYCTTKFQKVIGIGHSLGSILTTGIASQYTADLDAAVLTGFSVDAAGFPVFFAGLNLVLAKENNLLRFGLLQNGYIISDTKVSNQFGFFRYPNFSPAVLDASEKAKQTLSIGEFFTNALVLAPAPGFSGPIDIVDGENDLPFCQSNCLNNGNRAAEVKGALFPAASAGSDSFILKGAGHGLNLHYGAKDADEHVAGFLAKNGY